MQAKMASRSRLLNGAYQQLFALWVPVFVLGVKYLPLRLLHFLGGCIMRVFLFLRPKYKLALLNNFAHILGAATTDRRVRTLVRRMAENHARYWIEFFYWSEVGAEAARQAIREIVNLEALESCIEAGRGVVALTAHIGNWEMGGLLLGDRAGEMAIVYVPDRFDVLESYRSRYRGMGGVKEIPLGDDPFSALAALRVLRSKGVVAVQGDRDFDNSGLAVPFFGRLAYFPRGPAVLSLIAKAPILPVFILRAEDDSAPFAGGFRIVVFDPIEPAGEPGDPAAVESMVLQSVRIIETVVRANPEQWYCFYPLWDDPSRTDEVAGARRDSPRRCPGGAPTDRPPAGTV